MVPNSKSESQLEFTTTTLALRQHRTTVYYCDVCWIPHYWSQHRPTYWGNYVRENWQKLSGAALEFGYKQRYLDVTWRCVSCEMKIRNIEDAECYEAVAADMGVFV